MWVWIYSTKDLVHSDNTCVILDLVLGMSVRLVEWNLPTIPLSGIFPGILWVTFSFPVPVTTPASSGVGIGPGRR